MDLYFTFILYFFTVVVVGGGEEYTSKPILSFFLGMHMGGVRLQDILSLKLPEYVHKSILP